MPEGPEIRRAADTLEAAVKGQPLTAAWFAFSQLKAFESELIPGAARCDPAHLLRKGHCLQGR